MKSQLRKNEESKKLWPFKVIYFQTINEENKAVDVDFSS